MRAPVVLWAALACVFAAAEEAADATDAAAAPEVVEEEYTPPANVEGAQFYEPFVDGWDSRWVVSKDAEFTGKWKHEVYTPDALKGDKGLVVGDPAQRHAVSTTFNAPLDPKGTGLVVQYELQLKNGLECGGAYLKLLTASEELSLDGFHASTPYTIMFGPDKCGDTNKVHFILRHQSPATGKWEEKHLVTPPVPNVSDKLTHLYTAIVGADNTVKILVDNVEKKSASLLSDTDFKPPVNPPKEINDPTDAKPEDWVDEAKIDDPAASKPDDWDEDAPSMIVDPKVEKPAAWLDDAPLKVPDPSSEAPSDWDEEEDGEWEAPLIDNPECKAAGCGEWVPPKISNPEYKGKWFAPRIDNPAYSGVWEPKKIPNPDFFEDEAPHAMAPIGGIGIELWTMQNGILFDNVLVSTDPSVAKTLASGTFVKRSEMESKANRHKPADGEGLTGKAKGLVYSMYYYVQDHPLAIALALCLGLLPLILFCCWPSSKSSSSPAASADDDDDDEAEEEEPDDEDEGAAVEDVTEEKEKEEVKEEVKEEEKPPKSSGARKRTPKAAE